MAAVVLILVGLAARAARAADCPRFRGPTGNGVFEETGLLKTWPADGPKLAWSAKGLGEGYSSAVVAGGTVYVTGQDSTGQGLLFAFGEDGSEKWKAPYGPEVGKLGPARPGSRGSPTVDGDRVYVVSGFGRLVTLDAKTGKELAAVDLPKRFGGKMLRFGCAESVLVDGEKVVCTPGGPDASIVALDKKTGETIWQSKGLSQPSGYCSASLIEVGGKKIVTTMLGQSVVGVDAATGKVLWAHANRQGNDMQPNSPVYADGIVYATAGRGTGGVALALSADGTSATQKWTDKTLDNSMQGVVVIDGHVYGTAGGRGGKGLICLELAGGKVAWTAPEVKAGALVAAEGMLYIYGSDGTVRLVKPDAKAYTPVSQFKVTHGAGMHLAHPTIANGRLYIRHGDALAAYDIAAK